MPAPLSIIVPTLNAENQLPGLLIDLMEGVETGLIRDLVIVDGGSSDRTVHIAHETGANLVETKAGRGHQLRMGAGEAKAVWLLFLHADSRLSNNWTAAVSRHLVEHPDVAGYFALKFDDGTPMARLTAAWANVRSVLFGLPYGDQGLLVSRDLYENVGGFDELPLMEDVAMARKLKRKSSIGATIVTSGGRYRRNGWLRQGSRNLWTLFKYLLGANPADLAIKYERRS